MINLGVNYYPTLNQASYIYGVSAWALERMIDEHNRRFPDSPIVPHVKATDSPALWKKSDLEPVVQRYFFQRDVDSAILRATMREMLRMFKEMRDSEKKLPTLKAIRNA